MGTKVSLTFPPKRVVSLVPSQTELLHDLGLDEEVIGITKFCVEPISWHQSKAKIGGTKNLRFDVIDSLSPDLIFGNKEENEKSSIEMLRKKYPVWMSDVITFKDALTMIISVSELCNKKVRGENMVAEIEKRFQKIAKKEATVLYLIWRDPWMGVGANTFIDSMIAVLGYKNILASHSRYPIINLDHARELNPEHIFLSSEPYPFEEKHVDELKSKFPATRISLVDGQYFSWYGSRLLKAPDYFNQLLA